MTKKETFFPHPTPGTRRRRQTVVRGRRDAGLKGWERQGEQAWGT